MTIPTPHDHDWRTCTEACKCDCDGCNAWRRLENRPACTCPPQWNPLAPLGHAAGCPSMISLYRCRGCKLRLDPVNDALADGCPCNPPRGVNHGIVSKAGCTCKECNPPRGDAVRPGDKGDQRCT